MSNTTITARQLYWREHVLAAAAHDGSIVDYAQAHNLKTKDIYQWKTLLTKRCHSIKLIRNEWLHVSGVNAIGHVN